MEMKRAQKRKSVLNDPLMDNNDSDDSDVDIINKDIDILNSTSLANNTKHAEQRSIDNLTRNVSDAPPKICGIKRMYVSICVLSTILLIIAACIIKYMFYPSME